MNGTGYAYNMKANERTPITEIVIHNTRLMYETGYAFNMNKRKSNEWAPVNGIVVRKYIFFNEAFKVCRHVYLATRSAAPSSSQQKNLV